MIVVAALGDAQFHGRPGRDRLRLPEAVVRFHLRLRPQRGQRQCQRFGRCTKQERHKLCHITLGLGPQRHPPAATLDAAVATHGIEVADLDAAEHGPPLPVRPHLGDAAAGPGFAQHKRRVGNRLAADRVAHHHRLFDPLRQWLHPHQLLFGVFALAANPADAVTLRLLAELAAIDDAGRRFVILGLELRRPEKIMQLAEAVGGRFAALLPPLAADVQRYTIEQRRIEQHLRLRRLRADLDFAPVWREPRRLRQQPIATNGYVDEDIASLPVAQ